nr:MAG TPA: hypothetical protein [Caudoviricetes sp.]
MNSGERYGNIHTTERRRATENNEIWRKTP